MITLDETFELEEGQQIKFSLPGESPVSGIVIGNGPSYVVIRWEDGKERRVGRYENLFWTNAVKVN